jgi:lysophospholipase L1-like esterase
MAPVPVETFNVIAQVFYDENNNGMLDVNEGARVPDVTLEIRGNTGRSARVSGEVTVPGVPRGTHPVSLNLGNLPYFYTPPAQPLTVTVPQSANLVVPLTLDIGTNRPHVYMAFGDSITNGDGSGDDQGYRDRLRNRLAAHFGRGQVVNEGVSGGRSPFGAQRMPESLRRARPAYSLIMYGTNDWNDAECKMATAPCYTIDNLRDMILSARGSQSLPVLATLPPSNPQFEDRGAEERNRWVADISVRIRALAREQNVPVADVQAAFARAGSLPRLFVDHIHPNDDGYEIIAQEFFRAVSTAREAPPATSGLPFRLFFRAPARPQP